MTALLRSVLVVVGTAILLYPSAAGWFTAREQAVAMREASVEFGGLAASSLAASLVEAESFNKRLAAGESVEGLNYDAVLATGTGVMGAISIPAIDTALPIYHGTSDATLALGVGHLEATSFPVGGASTHAALSAHHGVPEARMFDRLGELTSGDRFTIDVFGRTLAYQVIGTQVVLPEDVAPLRIQPGRDLVTLITCTPLGVNTHRLLVTAERVPLAADDELTAHHVADPGWPWWALILAGAVLLAGLLFWFDRRRSARANPPARLAALTALDEAAASAPTPPLERNTKEI